MPEGNPYAPPTAPVRDTEPRTPRSLTLAVLAGLAVGVGGTILSRAVLGIVLVGLKGVPESPEATAAILSSAIVPALSLGCIFSVLGGYVGVRVARRHERRVTLALAVLSTAISFATTFGATGPLAMLVLTLTFASVMVGGGLGRYRNVVERRRTAAVIAA